MEGLASKGPRGVAQAAARAHNSQYLPVERQRRVGGVQLVVDASLGQQQTRLEGEPLAACGGVWCRVGIHEEREREKRACDEMR